MTRQRGNNMPERPECTNITISVTPNQTLAEIIATALIDAGVIPTDKKDDLQEKLTEGTASIGDWRLWAENSIEHEQVPQGGEDNG